MTSSANFTANELQMLEAIIRSMQQQNHFFLEDLNLPAFTAEVQRRLDALKRESDLTNALTQLYTNMRQALQNVPLSTFQELIQRGLIKPRFKDHRGKILLIESMKYNMPLYNILFRILYPVMESRPNPFNRNIFLAATSGDLQSLRYLVENRRADKNSTTQHLHNTIVHGMKPIFIACVKGHRDIVRYLIESGVSVNTKDEFRQTPLYFASFSGHLEIVKDLIDYHADVNSANSIMETPLYIACCNGFLDVVKYLVRKRANYNARNKYLVSCLHVASMNNHTDIIEYLVHIGANISDRDIMGNTPNDYASFFITDSPAATNNGESETTSTTSNNTLKQSLLESDSEPQHAIKAQQRQSNIQS